MTTMREVHEGLAHHGVKGMKWGRHKAKTDSDSSKGPAKTPAKKLSRKEVRAVNREGRAAFNEARAQKLMDVASKKGDKVLLKIVTPGSTYPTVVTGKEFMTHLANGGAFDVRVSDVYATAGKTGPYVLNETPTERYQKVKR